MKTEVPAEPTLSGAPYISWVSTPENDPANVAALAWAMLAIQAKYVYRSPGQAALNFPEFICSLIEKATKKRADFGNPADELSQEGRMQRLRAMSEALRTGCPGFSRPAESVGHLLDTVALLVEPDLPLCDPI